MDNYRFYVLFNIFSIISGQWEDDNERMCTMESCLGIDRYLTQAGLKRVTARSVN